MTAVRLADLEPGALFELVAGRVPPVAHDPPRPDVYELVARAAGTCVVVRVEVGAQLELLARPRSKHTERWSGKTLVVPRLRVGA